MTQIQMIQILGLVCFYQQKIDITRKICELQIWKQKGKCVAVGTDEVLKSNALDAIKYCDPIIFPNIFIFLKMLCTMPCRKELFHV